MGKLLEKYLREIEKKKEFKRKELLNKTLKALEELSKEFLFKEAYIFGSIIKEKKFYYDSDIDIAVSGLKDEDFFRFMARLYDILGREVEVVQLEEHPFKDKIIKEAVLWKKQR